ncbi:hypothetical protein TBLA_0D00230 [Henningerozyma blattae CBS 6284]|uniref:Asparaginase n=1 Tax=Henningerozyma blattae (strain ATCC 34711 / CBS 6284 / DSM 70876 / NBRC 10599 / NRRL Y-10934 / UCD 77-7) TaxID=1071380 RepID=I2H2D1_HENB6|nr:hypothetical protein TBLA_0D00230 [Tetrapisispora blattae CBS 6284]CCH60533.1 hypothetical protein TBLA_0D00230 [Tetrapisispora blattae CBS 6284]
MKLQITVTTLLAASATVLASPVGDDSNEKRGLGKYFGRKDAITTVQMAQASMEGMSMAPGETMAGMSMAPGETMAGMSMPMSTSSSVTDSATFATAVTDLSQPSFTTMPDTPLVVNNSTNSTSSISNGTNSTFSNSTINNSTTNNSTFSNNTYSNNTVSNSTELNNTASRTTTAPDSEATRSVSNSTALNGTSGNQTNGTNVSGANDTKPVPDRFLYVYTGGKTQLLTNTSHYDFITLYNTTNALNSTELYNVSKCVNESLASRSYSGIIVLGNPDSIESLSFFNAITLNTTFPVIVSEDADLGMAVAMVKGVAKYGPVVAVVNNIVYPGVYAPNVANSDSTNGIPIGVCNDANSVDWYFESIYPTIIRDVQANFRNFTEAPEKTDAIVPILSYNSAFPVNSLPLIKGLVIEARGTNFTSVDVKGAAYPIIFASDNAYVGPSQVPEGAIAGGSLDVTKSQLLLSIAVSQGVTNATELQKLFI